jgi:hypothetical protein
VQHLGERDRHCMYALTVMQCLTLKKPGGHTCIIRYVAMLMHYCVNDAAKAIRYITYNMHTSTIQLQCCCCDSHNTLM